jgi:ribonuclease HI
MSITVYVDGSGHARGGPGGCGYVAVTAAGRTFEGKCSLPAATNQQAELLAAAYALHSIPAGSTVTVRSDSEYVVNGWGWLDGWIERGWRTRTGAVANRRHWERLITAVQRHERVTFEWIAGHSGIEHNERADVLAGEARREQIATARERDALAV